MPPISHIVPRLSDRPLLHFLLLLGGLHALRAGAELSLFLSGDDAAEPDLDGSVEEQFVLEENLLLEGEAADVDVQFAEDVKVEDVAVVEVEAWMGKGVPDELMLLIARERLISREAGT